MLKKGEAIAKLSTEKPDDKPSTGGNAQTGDNTPLLLRGGLLLASAVGLVCIWFFLLRKKLVK